MLSRIKTPPRIPELIFAAVLFWLFASGQGWSVLLADGDTGWHIRNGEQIIDTRTVPHEDAFSFGSVGRAWFAWEWLSDVLFAAVFRAGGLRAVAVLSGIVIAASVCVLFRHMIWRSVGVCVALPLTFIAVGASSIHYLARPHVIGLFLFAVTTWILDYGREHCDRLIWSLPPLFLFWANVHGSFLAGLAMLAIWAGERLIFSLRAGPASRACIERPAVLFGLACAATFCNPYGWQLHAHTLQYLTSDWIKSAVEEFQSPRFRSENMMYYEILLIAGLSSLPWLIRRHEFYPACAIVLWAHESLSSVRHVPLYCLACCPFIGSWTQHLWDRAARQSRPGSLFSAFNSINLDWKPWMSGFTVWPIILATAAVVTSGTGTASNFPPNKFPVALIERNAWMLHVTTGRPQRVFSSDQWSDYLIFRCYPAVRIFFDGRSDFFGPWRGQAYERLMTGGAGAAGILTRENVDVALLPKDWPLTSLLGADANWLMVDSDDQAVLYRRTTSKSTLALMKIPVRADRSSE